ncbi:unnamed protein product [Mytilus coruscus]|uniref:Uncharacterized protein n=1 Tax=Mytilus coruscus TaxID=42192 RepID=A0A6J8AQU9_MYTCO|nr:unnamed protein product [Mytilus coruscus]
MRDIITSTLEKFPLCKIVLSAPTPRADSCSLNSQGQLISALLKNEYVNNEKVFFCDNSNLSFKGKAIQRFLSKDQFHLSSQGVNVLASNIRDAIDEALKLPKRIPAQQRNSDYRNYSHTNTDYRDYYDYGQSNTDYRNYDEPHNNSPRGDCHCKLSFGILASYSVERQDLNQNETTFLGKYIWSTKAGQKLCDALTQADAKYGIKNFLDKSFENTSDDIENAVNTCHEIIVNAANKATVFKKPVKHKKRKNKNFFDTDLKTKREILISKEKLLSKFPFDPIVRGSYFKCYREYNKSRKRKKREFKQKILDSLDGLREDNPKEYWNLIKSLKDDKKEGPEETVNTNVWYTYFKSLNKIPDKYKSRINQIDKILKNMELSHSFNELDFRITSKEVLDAIFDKGGYTLSQ